MEHILNQATHRRYNILTGEWVLVSPHRTKRPWQGQQEKVAKEARPSYDPTCYLCPGNTRAGGAQTAVYTDTYVFDNDFGATATKFQSSMVGSLVWRLSLNALLASSIR